MNETDFEVEFEKVLAEFTRRVREGEAPSVEEFASANPELREQIESLFPVVGCLEKTRMEKAAANSAQQRRWKFSGKSQLGDYELVREIGRGGMGVVYEARQRSLDRKVALKVLPAEQAMTPVSVARFQREARMAAQLHHSHIVPVLGHGQEAGNHFIAMQLIDGVGLDRVAARLRGDASVEGDSPVPQAEVGNSSVPAFRDVTPDEMVRKDITSNDATPIPLGDASAYEAEIATRLFPDGYGTNKFWDRVAEIGVGVSRALAHSHDKFILHRDIKPSNLLVDLSGKTWVADFGLARSFEGITAEDMTRETGTPRYMAPEQILGQASERSDVYSFGLTLYELVSSQRVFSESALDDHSNFRSKKQTGLKPVREIAAEVPADLAKIIDKCVQVDPRNRYQSALQLADDFQRVLDRLPLAHVNTPFWTKAARWTQRNPALATAAAIAFASVLAVAVVSVKSFEQQRAELSRTKAALQISVNTLDKVYERLTPNDLTLLNQFSETEDRATSQLSKANAQLLGELLESYDQLAQLDGDGQIQIEAAQANFRVGEINRRLGKTEEARSALQRSIEINEAIARDEPKFRADANTRIIQGYIALASTDLISDSRVRQRNLEKAIDFSEAILNDSSYNLSDWNRQTINFELAKALYRMGQRPKRTANQFSDFVQPAGEGKGGDKKGGDKKGGGRKKRGGKRRMPPPGSKGRPRNAEREMNAREAYIRRAIEILQEWNEPRPANVRSLLSICYGENSYAFNDQACREAIQIQKSLVREFPESQVFKANLAALLGNVDPLRIDPIEFPAAIMQLRESNRMAAQLDKNDTSIRTLIKHNHHKLAIIFNIVAIQPELIPKKILARFKDDPMAEPIEDALFHGRTSLRLHMDSNDGENGGRRNNHYWAWRLRFQVCLARSLWFRNRGTDRTRVIKMYEESVDEIGPLNQSSRRERELITMLERLGQIAKQANIESN